MIGSWKIWWIYWVWYEDWLWRTRVRALQFLVSAGCLNLFSLPLSLFYGVISPVGWIHTLGGRGKGNRRLGRSLMSDGWFVSGAQCFSSTKWIAHRTSLGIIPFVERLWDRRVYELTDWMTDKCKVCNINDREPKEAARNELLEESSSCCWCCF